MPVLQILCHDRMTRLCKRLGLHLRLYAFPHTQISTSAHASGPPQLRHSDIFGHPILVRQVTFYSQRMVDIQFNPLCSVLFTKFSGRLIFFRQVMFHAEH